MAAKKKSKPAAKASKKKVSKVKKAPAKKAAPKAKAKVKVAKAKTKRKPNAAFMKPMTPSALLAAVVGSKALPRTEVVKKLWEHIKKNKLQDSVNRRMINADDKLRAIFGSNQFSMFDLAKGLKKHLS